MNKSLKDAIGIINQGLARNSHYDVVINKPGVVVSTLFDYQAIQKIGLLCESAQLPGMNLSTAGTRTYGEVREMPYEKLYDPLTLQFLVDKEMKVKLFFDEWMGGIQNSYTRTFAYYEEYVTDMEIIVYDVSNYPRYTVTLYEAYPKTIASVGLDYSNKEVMKLSVTMQYKYWRTEIMTSPSSVSKGVNVINGAAGPSGVAIPSSRFNTPSLDNLDSTNAMQKFWVA
jgi:hypothetical protein